MQSDGPEGPGGGAAGSAAFILHCLGIFAAEAAALPAEPALDVGPMLAASMAAAFDCSGADIANAAT